MKHQDLNVPINTKSTKGKQELRGRQVT